jgi:ATP synthase
VRSVRELERRLQAWRTFRDVAHATRSLAAAQLMRWTGYLTRATQHLVRAQAIHGALPDRPPAPARGETAPAGVLLALGTDLGLCGRLNVQVAEAVLASWEELRPELVVIVGSRLQDALPTSLPVLVEAAPTTPAAASELADRVEAEARILGSGGWPPALCVVAAFDLSADNAPRVTTQHATPDHHPELTALRGQLADQPRVLLTPGHTTARESAWILFHARVTHAGVAAVRAEAGARLATMSRAHESAEARITEQQRELRKARQEHITQEMLEVLSGRARALDEARAQPRPSPPPGATPCPTRSS